MRYLGALGPSLFANLPPEGRARVLTEAPSMSDEDATFLLEVVDRTDVGSRSKLTRIGIGAGAGLAAGLLVAIMVRRK